MYRQWNAQARGRLAMPVKELGLFSNSKEVPDTGFGETHWPEHPTIPNADSHGIAKASGKDQPTHTVKLVQYLHAKIRAMLSCSRGLTER